PPGGEVREPELDGEEQRAEHVGDRRGEVALQLASHDDQGLAHAPPPSTGLAVRLRNTSSSVACSRTSSAIAQPFLTIRSASASGTVASRSSVVTCTRRSW